MEINATLFIQLFIFLSLLLILSNYLFSPLLSLFDKREFFLKEVKTLAAMLREETEKLKLQWEEKLLQARQEAKKELSDFKKLADNKAYEIINQTKETILNELKNHEQSLQEEKNSIKQNMNQISDKIAQEIVDIIKTRKLG